MTCRRDGCNEPTPLKKNGEPKLYCSEACRVGYLRGSVKKGKPRKRRNLSTDGDRQRLANFFITVGRGHAETFNKIKLHDDDESMELKTRCLDHIEAYANRADVRRYNPAQAEKMLEYVRLHRPLAKNPATGESVQTPGVLVGDV